LLATDNKQRTQTHYILIKNALKQ